MSRELPHEQIEELLAVRALGGLDGADVQILERELAAHSDCAECRLLEDEFAATAAMLADALEPEGVNPGMVEAILTSTEPALVAVPDVPETPDAIPGERNDLADRGRGRSSWRTAAGLAAAFVLIMVAGGLGLRSGGSVAVSTAALSQRIVRFEGDTGTLAAAYTPGEPGAVLFGTGLPKADSGEVYEIWTITGTEPTSAGCTDSANGGLHASVPLDVSGADVLAITIEPAACPSAPTTAPILTASLS